MYHKGFWVALLLCFILPSIGFAQVTWEKTFGGSGWDMGIFVEKTLDQCYLIGGETRSFGSEGDIYILKIDENGNVLWEKNFGGDEYDYSEDIVRTLDGNFVIVGNTFYGGETVEEDVYILKIDDSGDLIWEKRIERKGCDQAFSVQEAPDGGYIICGGTKSFSEDFNIYVLKLNKDGELVWEKTIGNEEEEIGRAVILVDEDKFVILAYRGQEESRDIYLVCLDKDGNIVWEKVIDIETSIFPISIDKTSDDGYIIAGYKGILGENSPYIAKLNDRWDLIWDGTFGGGGIASSVRETIDKNYIVVGSIYTLEANTDVYLFKLDISGNLLWEKTYGGSDDDLGISIQLTSDDGYIIIGQTLSFGKGESDLYVLKVDAEGNLLEDK